MNPRDDFSDLMRRVRAGEGEAARQLYDRYGQDILRVVRRRLHHPLRTRFNSSDFAQAVWASFFAKVTQRHQFDSPEQLVNFLQKMAACKVAGAYRHDTQAAKRDRTRERSLHEPLEEGGGAPQSFLAADCPTPSQEAVAREHWDRLMEGQPDGVRRILALLRDDYTHEEIAESLGVHPKTIQRLLRRLDTGRNT